MKKNRNALLAYGCEQRKPEQFASTVSLFPTRFFYNMLTTNQTKSIKVQPLGAHYPTLDISKTIIMDQDDHDRDNSDHDIVFINRIS